MLHAMEGNSFGNQQKGVLHVLELIYQYHSKQEHRFVAPFFCLC